MKTTEVLSYIYDFLSIVFDKTRDIENVILFGSVARGNFTKKSDIDLFFDTLGSERKIERLISDSLYEFEAQANIKWKPRGLTFPIRVIVGNLNDKRWASLRRDLISEGLTLFGKFKTLPKNLAHHTLFIYKLEGIEEKEKVKVIRRLFGYKTKKGRKIYQHTGLLEKLNGIKLSKNIVLVPVTKTNELFEFFNKYKVKTTIRDVWFERT
jgi:predicted nucleotidyltransferase